MGEFVQGKEHLDMMASKPAGLTRTSGTLNDHNYVLIDLAVRQRDRTMLTQHLPEVEEMAILDGHILYQASAHRAWGVLYRLTGEYSESEIRLAKALELFQGLETRWQIGRTLFEIAELDMAQNNVTKARDYYRRALASFEEMDAAPDIMRTRAALLSLDA
jgi:tetratricopeptide (TPR) repeat protein